MERAFLKTVSTANNDFSAAKKRVVRNVRGEVRKEAGIEENEKGVVLRKRVREFGRFLANPRENCSLLSNWLCIRRGSPGEEENWKRAAGMKQQQKRISS